MHCIAGHNPPRQEVRGTPVEGKAEEIFFSLGDRKTLNMTKCMLLKRPVVICFYDEVCI